MGLLSAIGNLFGARKKKAAVRGAANEIIGKAGEGIGVLNSQFADTQGRVDGALAGVEGAVQGFAPMQDAGNDATGALRGLLGLDGADAQAAALDMIKASPMFESLFRTGEEAVLSNASATGGLRGGNTQRSLADFGSDTLARLIQDQYTKLSGVADRGLQAGQSMLSGRGQQLSGQLGLGQVGAANSGRVAQLLGIQGDAKAGGILGAAKASLEKYGAVGDLAGMAFNAIPGLGGMNIGNTTLGKLI